MTDDNQRRMGRPTLDEAATLQQRILDETLGMLRSTGSDGFSVDKLAEQTGITKRTIYRHYKNKDGLIIAVVGREIELLISSTNDIHNGENDTANTCIEAFRRWAYDLFKYTCNPEAIAFSNYLNFESFKNPALRKEGKRWREVVLNHACNFISAGQKNGIIRQGEVKRFAILFFDMIPGMYIHSTLDIELKDLMGDDPDEYFMFRWMGYMSLISDHPWAHFIKLNGADNTDS